MRDPKQTYCKQSECNRKTRDDEAGEREGSGNRSAVRRTSYENKTGFPRLLTQESLSHRKKNEMARRGSGRIRRKEWRLTEVANMMARLATANDGNLACANEASTIHDRDMTLRSARDEQQVGAIQFDSGYLSPFFVTHPERMEVALENVFILIHENKIDSRNDLLPLLEQIARAGKPLLIIAEDVDGEALAALVVNKLCGPLQVAAVRAPGSGDQRKHMLEEIALLTGAKAIGEGLDVQLKNIQIGDLGQARKILIDRNKTMVEGRSRDAGLSFQA